ncbi:MAG: hypothetical protein V1729_04300 [Candidatus Woesearchaeota archaeon]
MQMMSHEDILSKLLENFHRFTNFFRKKQKLEQDLKELNLQLKDVAEIYYEENRKKALSIDASIDDMIKTIEYLLKLCRDDFELESAEIRYLRSLEHASETSSATEQHILNLHTIYTQLKIHLEKQKLCFSGLKKDSASVIRAFKKKEKLNAEAVKSIESLSSKIKQFEAEETQLWNDLVSVGRMLEADGKLILEQHDEEIRDARQEVLVLLNRLDALYAGFPEKHEGASAEEHKKQSADILKKIGAVETELSKKERLLKDKGIPYKFKENDVYLSIVNGKQKDGHKSITKPGAGKQEAGTR